MNRCTAAPCCSGSGALCLSPVGASSGVHARGLTGVGGPLYPLCGCGATTGVCNKLLPVQSHPLSLLAFTFRSRCTEYDSLSCATLQQSSCHSLQHLLLTLCRCQQG